MQPQVRDDCVADQTPVFTLVAHRPPAYGCKSVNRARLDEAKLREMRCKTASGWVPGDPAISAASPRGSAHAIARDGCDAEDVHAHPRRVRRRPGRSHFGGLR